MVLSVSSQWHGYKLTTREPAKSTWVIGARDQLLHVAFLLQSFLLVHLLLLCSLVKVDLPAKHTQRNEALLIKTVSVLPNGNI